MFFCDNPQCPLHVEVPQNHLEFGRIRRVRYAVRAGEEFSEFHLCETCSNVSQVYQQKQEELEKRLKQRMQTEPEKF